MGLIIVGAVVTWILYKNRLQEEREREAQRQVLILRKAADAIVRYRDDPNMLTKHDAEVALDEAGEQGISSNKQQMLFNFHLDVEKCRELGDRKACLEAIRDEGKVMKISPSAE
ncbi:MAG: hypothetical protein DMG49_23280 [Acidobacteria bacterium]|nr:MAG: hypothetical protein DMG49_23280 [Acidobacteriota bacterium]